ncbi:hypothetical protein [Chromobacterium haemolyticum]|uniref:hypothetical protein n=1 Tax=Chromobacterium haemolyticum TaxID=394935 RepID=UPI0009DAB64F|nr:hypothetical protein [Chromobacterium haemolyticum]OQS35948.1 hypothetical protein B0T39_17420 [Chromobacterium haemolyticum]
MNNGNQVLTRSQSIHTTDSDKNRPEVPHRVCDIDVPPAAESIIGHCEFYYRPLHEEYVKKSGVTSLKALSAWASTWNPWDDMIVAAKLLRNRDKLILANSSNDNWSRHASFMMRHIGCGHKPPDYYVSYGYYYCSNYGKKLFPRLSSAGQEWLENGRWFLQKNMEKGLSDNMMGNTLSIPCKRYPNRSVASTAPKKGLEIDNAKFKRFAFDTHVPAYLDAGLADLPVMDLAMIGGQPNIEEWLDKDTWRQAIDSGMEVGNDWIKKGKQAGQDMVDSALKRLTSVFK